MTFAMVRCGRVVVILILTEKSAQMHMLNATNQNLHEMAMMTRPKTTGKWKGAKNRNLATK